MIFLPEKSMQFVLVWLVLIRIESIKVHVIVRAIVHIESATNLRLICQWMYLKNQNSDLINGIKRNSMKNWSYLWNEQISFGIKSQNAEADIHSDDKYKTKLKLPCVTWCYSVHKIDRLPFVPSNVMLFIGFFRIAVQMNSETHYIATCHWCMGILYPDSSWYPDGHNHEN